MARGENLDGVAKVPVVALGTDAQFGCHIVGMGAGRLAVSRRFGLRRPEKRRQPAENEHDPAC